MASVENWVFHQIEWNLTFNLWLLDLQRSQAILVQTVWKSMNAFCGLRSGFSTLTRLTFFPLVFFEF
jgi:hypothetical protein